MPAAPGGGRRRLPGQARLEPGRGVPSGAASPGRQGEGVPRERAPPHAFLCRPPRGLTQASKAEPAAAHAPAGGAGQGEGRLADGSVERGGESGTGRQFQNIKTTEPPSPPTGVASRARKMCGAGLGSAPRLSEVRLGEPRPRTPRTAGTPEIPSLPPPPLGATPGAAKQKRRGVEEATWTRLARLRAGSGEAVRDGSPARWRPKRSRSGASLSLGAVRDRSGAGQKRWEFLPGNRAGSRMHWSCTSCFAPLRL